MRARARVDNTTRARLLLALLSPAGAFGFGDARFAPGFFFAVDPVFSAA